MATTSDVSQLFQFCDKNKLKQPDFAFENHESGFFCLLTLDKELVRAWATSKRDAKHLAARKMLFLLQNQREIYNMPAVPSSKSEEKSRERNNISAFHEFCSKNKRPVPEVEIVYQDNGFKCFALVNGKEMSAWGSSKQKAKNSFFGKIFSFYEADHEQKSPNASQPLAALEGDPDAEPIVNFKLNKQKNKHSNQSASMADGANFSLGVLEWLTTKPSETSTPLTPPTTPPLSVDMPKSPLRSLGTKPTNRKPSDFDKEPVVSTSQMTATKTETFDSHVTGPNTDYTSILHHYCKKNKLPDPDYTFEFTLKSFNCHCTIGHLQVDASGLSKRSAKKIASKKIMELLLLTAPSTLLEISSQLPPQKKSRKLDDLELDVVDIGEAEKQNTSELNAKFRQFREINNLRERLMFSELADRHKFFSKYDQKLKDAAFRVIYSDVISCPEKKALFLLEVLNLQPTETQVDTIGKTEPFYFIELNCVYDVCFAGSKPSIYEDIISYFEVMLK